MVHEDYGKVMNELFDELSELNPTTVELVFALNQLKTYYCGDENAMPPKLRVAKLSNDFFEGKKLTNGERVYVIEFALTQLIQGVKLVGALNAAANKEEKKKKEAQRFSCA